MGVLPASDFIEPADVVACWFVAVVRSNNQLFADTTFSNVHA
jgi:hypothetical protein